MSAGQIITVASDFSGTGWDFGGTVLTMNLAALGAVVGDVAIAAFQRDVTGGDDNSSIGTPSGWLKPMDAVSGTKHCEVYYRFLASTASVNFTLPGGSDNSRWYGVYRNVMNDQAGVIRNGTASGTSQNWPTVTGKYHGIYVGVFGTESNAAGPTASAPTVRSHYSVTPQWEANMGIFTKPVEVKNAAERPAISATWAPLAWYVNFMLPSISMWDESTAAVSY